MASLCYCCMFPKTGNGCYFFGCRVRLCCVSPDQRGFVRVLNGAVTDPESPMQPRKPDEAKKMWVVCAGSRAAPRNSSR